MRESWEAALRATVPYDCEYRLRGADGAYRWIEAHAVPLPDDGDRPRYFGVGHDISERKAAEEAVRRRARLESMAAAVSARLAGATLDTAGLAGDFALSELGRHLGADGVDLYVITADGAATESLHAWRRDDRHGRGRPRLRRGSTRLAWLRTDGPERQAAGASARWTTSRRMRRRSGRCSPPAAWSPPSSSRCSRRVRSSACCRS